MIEVAKPEDAAGVRTVRKEFARRPIDISLMNITFHHGVVRLGGQVKTMRGHDLDLRAELESIAKALRTRDNIREVVIECIFRS